MFATIPLLSLFLICAFFHLRKLSRGEVETPCWRTAVLAGGITWGVILVFGTEMLSLLGAFSFEWVLAFWALTALVGAIACVAFYVRARRVGKISFKPPPAIETVFLLPAAMIALAVLGIVLIAPPTTWDSMTYHMARIVHWIQNRSVEHYPTHIDRQLYLAPGAEYVILHFQILSNGDRLAGLPQWLGMIGSIIGVSLIARQLGASSRGQALSALLVATIPMGILQGSTTQNDHVAAFWAVCFCAYALELIRGQRHLSKWAAAAGALALCILTKGTAYVIVGPFLLWLLVAALWRLRLRALGPLAVSAAIVVILNALPLWRNYRTFGSPLGPVTAYRTEELSVKIVLSNVARNAALHLATPSEEFNHKVEDNVISFHRLIGISHNSPKSTWKGARFRLMKTRFSESIDGNFLHFLLGIACSVLLVISRRSRNRRLAMGYVLALILSLSLFSALLKWQPWHSRLHLPLFVLGSAFVAAVLDISSRKGKRLIIVAVVLFAAASPYVLANEARSYVGKFSILKIPRMAQYFRRRFELRRPYVGTVRFLKRARCKRIGLLIGSNSWEYPLWALLRHKDDAEYRIEHVEVLNASKDLAYPAAESAQGGRPFVPEAIIVIRRDRKERTLAFGGRTYVLAFRSDPVDVFLISTRAKGVIRRQWSGLPAAALQFTCGASTAPPALLQAWTISRSRL